VDQVNVKPHFSPETTILLCPVQQTLPFKSLCLRLSGSGGRIRPEEISNGPTQGHRAASFEGGADKLEVHRFGILMDVHKPVFFHRRLSASRATGLPSASAKPLPNSQAAQAQSHASG